jgi:hypothetical protein
VKKWASAPPEGKIPENNKSKIVIFSDFFSLPGGLVRLHQTPGLVVPVRRQKIKGEDSVRVKGSMLRVRAAQHAVRIEISLPEMERGGRGRTPALWLNNHRRGQREG